MLFHIFSGSWSFGGLHTVWSGRGCRVWISLPQFYRDFVRVVAERWWAIHWCCVWRCTTSHQFPVRSSAQVPFSSNPGKVVSLGFIHQLEWVDKMLVPDVVIVLCLLVALLRSNISWSHVKHNFKITIFALPSLLVSCILWCYAVVSLNICFISLFWPVSSVFVYFVFIFVLYLLSALSHKELDKCT